MRCDYCGTPLDDPYFLAAGPEPHSTAHCREYLKAALSHANRECFRLRSEILEARNEATAVRRAYLHERGRAEQAIGYLRESGHVIEADRLTDRAYVEPKTHA